MNDDLSPLIAAYRAENPGTALDARALRERVLTATWRRRRRRLRRAVWLLPIAAVLVGTGALAASAPARESVSRVLAELGLVAPAVSSPPPSHHAVSSRGRATTPSSAPPSDVPSTAVAAFETPSAALSAAAFPEAPSSSSSNVTSSHSPSPSRLLPRDRSPASAGLLGSTAEPSSRTAAARAAEPSDTPSETPDAHPATAPIHAASPATAASAALAADIAAYRAAHELHFSRSDYVRALVAWDGYLARFPHGTFTPEARLNRAVCLARLGKTTEAENVLRALAQSSDPYTRSRAARLLEAAPHH